MRELTVAEISKLLGEEVKVVKEKSKHIWANGDVFSFRNGGNCGTMIYLKNAKHEESVAYVSSNYKPYDEIKDYLKNAKFLFNIKDKLEN